MASGGDDDFRIGGPDEWSGALTVDRHACGLHLQEQQPLVPDTSTTSAGSSLETAARALLRLGHGVPACRVPRAVPRQPAVADRLGRDVLADQEQGWWQGLRGCRGWPARALPAAG